MANQHEIRHDRIAARVFEKAGAERQGRRRVKRLVEDKLAEYQGSEASMAKKLAELETADTREAKLFRGANQVLDKIEKFLPFLPFQWLNSWMLSYGREKGPLVTKKMLLQEDELALLDKYRIEIAWEDPAALKKYVKESYDALKFRLLINGILGALGLVLTLLAMWLMWRTSNQEAELAVQQANFYEQIALNEIKEENYPAAHRFLSLAIKTNDTVARYQEQLSQLETNIVNWRKKDVFAYKYFPENQSIFTVKNKEVALHLLNSDKTSIISHSARAFARNTGDQGVFFRKDHRDFGWIGIQRGESEKWYHTVSINEETQAIKETIFSLAEYAGFKETNYSKKLEKISYPDPISGDFAENSGDLVLTMVLEDTLTIAGFRRIDLEAEIITPSLNKFPTEGGIFFQSSITLGDTVYLAILWDDKTSLSIYRTTEGKSELVFSEKLINRPIQGNPELQFYQDAEILKVSIEQNIFFISQLAGTPHLSSLQNLNEDHVKSPFFKYSFIIHEGNNYRLAYLDANREVLINSYSPQQSSSNKTGLKLTRGNYRIGKPGLREHSIGQFSPDGNHFVFFNSSDTLTVLTLSEHEVINRISYPVYVNRSLSGVDTILDYPSSCFFAADGLFFRDKNLNYQRVSLSETVATPQRFSLAGKVIAGDPTRSLLYFEKDQDEHNQLFVGKWENNTFEVIDSVQTLNSSGRWILVPAQGHTNIPLFIRPQYNQNYTLHRQIYYAYPFGSRLAQIPSDDVWLSQDGKVFFGAEGVFSDIGYIQLLPHNVSLSEHLQTLPHITDWQPGEKEKYGIKD